MMYRFTRAWVQQRAVHITYTEFCSSKFIHRAQSNASHWIQLCSVAELNRTQSVD